MDLYLVRHAVAHKRDAERWPDDSKRPLTQEGEEQFRSAARGLGGVLPPVEALLSSPFARAWQTAQILTGETNLPDPQPFPALEPDVPPHKTLIALETHAEAGSLALVGHRPCLHELASYLLTGSAEALDVRIKKGGAVAVRFEGAPEPGAGRLLWVVTPELLGG